MRLLRATLVAAAVLALPGCAGAPGWEQLRAAAGQAPASAAARPAAASPAAAPDRAPDTQALNGLSLVATLRAPTPVLSAPGGARLLVQADRTDEGTQQRLLVLDDRQEWLRVALPGRPAGRSGWMRAAEVDLSATDWKLTVSLSQRTLTVQRGGLTFGSFPVGIGKASTPTPVGSFFLTDLMAPSDPAGSYGPFAFGLSAYSDVITSFGIKGRGQIGLHGTDDPDSVGAAVSNGCLRVDNETIRALAGQLPLGTPFEITA